MTDREPLGSSAARPDQSTASAFRALAGLRVLNTLRHRLRESIFAASFYRHTLRAKPRQSLAAFPQDPWRGDAARANALFQGRYRFAGSEVQLFNKAPWTSPAPSTAWLLEAAGFEWLRDFRAEGGEAATGRARALVRGFIESYGEWDPALWRADVLGRRILSWISHADFILQGADPAFRQGFLISLERQARHLLRAVALAPEGSGRIVALCAVLVADAAFGGLTRSARGAAGELDAELREQVLPDGCHISRNPSEHLRVLRDLLWLQHGLRAANAPVPIGVHATTERMGAMLLLSRHGDGALALFHGSNEEERSIVTETLAAVPARATREPMSQDSHAGSHSGYERMAAGNLLAILDAAAPAPEPFAQAAHAGTLAFELSVGRDRLVVNCGHRVGERWTNASRATAAHSTLVLDDANSTEITNSGLSRRPSVTLRRQEDDGSVWVDADHAGYADRAGCLHRRRVYLGAAGDTFRGEDTLDPAPGKHPQADLSFAVRFHLHPEVQVSLLADGALLRLPSGEGWRFRAAGSSIGLEESVYLGRIGEMRRAEQIVLTGTTAADGATIKWAFGRMEAER